MVLMVQWWNPLVHLVVQQMEQAGESACDDRVIGNGVPAADYSMTLLEVAREASLNRRFPKCAVTMARTLPIEKRLERLLDSGQSRIPLGALALISLSLVIALLAITVGTFTSQAQEPELDNDVTKKPSPPDSAIEGKLGTSLDLSQDIRLTSTGSAGYDPESNTIVARGNATISSGRFTVSADEITVQVKANKFDIISAKNARFSGPANLSGTCGLLIWKPQMGTVELREEVMMEMSREEGRITRCIESTDQTGYIDIRFQEGAFDSFEPKGPMKVTLRPKPSEEADVANEDRERGFLGIVMPQL